MRAALPCALVVVAAAGGCRFDSVRFYDVLRTPTQECDILPQGEFCVETEQLSPPTNEVWTVERRGDEVRVFVDDEVWVANEPAEDDEPDQVKADKLEIATRDPGPCTTTTTGSFDIVANAETLSGTAKASTRLEGAEDCGDTPRGERSVARLDGTVTGAP
jgi:hypothetical protein